MVRGASQTFGLGFTPGTWIESIQVTKGMGSVTNGFESIVGQINTEIKKPFNDIPFFFNLFNGFDGRVEANAHVKSTLSEKIHTTSFIHYNERKKVNDKNGDKFLDKPVQDQLNLLSKWQYTDLTKGIVSFLNIRYLEDNKRIGSIDFNEKIDLSKFWGGEILTTRLDCELKIVYLNTTFGPSIPKISPLLISKFISSKICLSPNDNETLVVPTDMGWLNFDKTESLIFPDQTDVISFIINSSNLNIGSYNGNLSVETNDPNSYTNIFTFNLNVGIADCFGTISGEAFLDDCGICSGGLSEHIPNSDVDCMGICFGNTTLDDCGICDGDNSYCSGCTNQNALNYDVNAIIDDNSCEFLGDINNDTNINVTDIVIMISIILDNQYNVYADMNFDNNINVVDIVILVDLILSE